MACSTTQTGHLWAVPHASVWINCGFYTVVVPDELAVHALEHGAIWIAYQPGSSANDLAVIESLVNDESHILATPYEDLRAPIVATAWGAQLDLDSAADAQLADFIGRHIRDGPEDAPCDRAVGIPPDQPLAAP